MKMVTWRVIQIAFSATLFAVLIGCGNGEGGSMLKDAPANTAALYKAKCLNCHGSELQGRVGANTNLTKVGSRMSAAEIAEQIQHGKGVMPGFADSLTDTEIHSIAVWLAEKK